MTPQELGQPAKKRRNRWPPSIVLFKNIDIIQHDLDILRDKKAWINDNIINVIFWCVTCLPTYLCLPLFLFLLTENVISYLHSQLSPENRAKVCVTNSFFLNLLRSNHQSALRLERGLNTSNIFTMDFLVLPWHVER